jgi:DNA damage-binding protein 1
VLAACDRPTVISSQHNKLTYSNVNLRSMHCVCAFNPASASASAAAAAQQPQSLAFESSGSLVIGSVDDIQRLHTRRIALDSEQPRRIAYQPSTNSYCLLTLKHTVEDKSGEAKESSYVRLLDDLQFECHSYVALQQWEGACSVASVRFAGAEDEYFVVGTAFALPDEPEPTDGRILVYRVQTASASSASSASSAAGGSGGGAAVAGAGGPDKKLVPVAEYRVNGLRTHFCLRKRRQGMGGRELTCE